MLEHMTWPRFRMTIAEVKVGIGFLFALLLGFIFLSSPLYASAHTSTARVDGPAMGVSAGFNGRFRDDNWVPVYITLSNNGSDFTGSVVVDIPTPYSNLGNSDP